MCGARFVLRTKLVPHLKGEMWGTQYPANDADFGAYVWVECVATIGAGHL